MGCFLGCFGGSKDRRCHKKRNKVIPREHQLLKRKAQNPVSIEQGNGSPPENLVSAFCDKPEQTTNSASKKRVTFNSDITTIEHVGLLYESSESLPDCKKFALLGKSESSNSRQTSDEGSFNSSIGSYPPNDRYQNCRDSDDEEVCSDSDLEDTDDDEESFTDCEDDGDIKFVSQEVWSESVSTESLESTTKEASGKIISEEVESPMLVPVVMHGQEVKTMKLKGNVRDRSDYVHPVLNPVENLTQWKTVKSRGTLQLKKPQKENFTAEVEAPPLSFSSEPTFKKSSSIYHPKSDQYKNLNQDIAVDTSLSTWLTSPGSTHTMASPSNCETVTSQKFSMSQGSVSAKSFEDRPILGAMTVEELKHLSASTSPRKSPCQSPDEMPILGTVGTYWNESTQTSDSLSASSFKGIPNTTSKYREDKRVHWHSTPFETRLERALKNRAGES